MKIQILVSYLKSVIPKGRVFVFLAFRKLFWRLFPELKCLISLLNNSTLRFVPEARHSLARTFRLASLMHVTPWASLCWSFSSKLGTRDYLRWSACLGSLGRGGYWIRGQRGEVYIPQGFLICVGKGPSLYSDRAVC